MQPLNYENPSEMSVEMRFDELAGILARGLSRVSQDSGTGALLHLQKEQKALAVAGLQSVHAAQRKERA